MAKEGRVKIDTLLDNLPENYTAMDRDLIRRAYHFAELAHEGQKRASGEAYITHCVAVAHILAEMKVPPSVVVAGLLHDTVEDTDVTVEDILLISQYIHTTNTLITHDLKCSHITSLHQRYKPLPMVDFLLSTILIAQAYKMNILRLMSFLNSFLPLFL